MRGLGGGLNKSPFINQTINTLNLKEFNSQNTEDKNTLTEILLYNKWDFHAGPPQTKEDVAERINSGYYNTDGCKTFFIQNEDDVTIGFIRIFDLGDDEEDDETPLFDIRINDNARGKGYGFFAVQKTIEYIFNTYPNKTRIEATTRHDNIPMRKVLAKSGFVKEAHYRESWPAGEVVVDTVGYGILRKDWESKSKTPVKWNDL